MLHVLVKVNDVKQIGKRLKLFGNYYAKDITFQSVRLYQHTAEFDRGAAQNVGGLFF